MKEVTVVKTGVANTASVMAALRRAGTKPTLSADSEALSKAQKVIVPGVGSFGAAMQTLEESELIDALTTRYAEAKPTLSICVGLQILANQSEETPGAQGLGVVGAKVKRFGNEVRVPQFGWNLVKANETCRLLQDGYAYFANSYYMEPGVDGWSEATSNHGVNFVAAMEKGALLACQFHLELSGKWGADLLDRWLTLSEEY